MLTKTEVDVDLLHEIVAPVGALRRAEPLTGGMFATTFRVTFDTGDRAVVKIVGGDESRLCTYERGLLRTEALIYRALEDSAVPVPRVLHTDFRRALLDADVVVASHLRGIPWQEGSFDAAQTAQIRRGLGQVMAGLHRERGPRFGYPAPEAGLAASTWRGAFERMVAAILADAERWGVELPVARVRAALETHGAALDAVAVPVVVHTDLWEGNVFVDPETLAITGIIDTERTLWGDPLHELVGADQFGTGEPDPDILQGDTEAGGVLAAELASPTGEVRLQLCRMYFSLILVTEPTLRGYDPEWGAGYEATARANLALALDRLEAQAQLVE